MNEKVEAEGDQMTIMKEAIVRLRTQASKANDDGPWSARKTGKLILSTTNFIWSKCR